MTLTFQKWLSICDIKSYKFSRYQAKKKILFHKTFSPPLPKAKAGQTYVVFYPPVLKNPVVVACLNILTDTPVVLGIGIQTEIRALY